MNTETQSAEVGPVERQVMHRAPALPFAVFDEFGRGADDRVQDYVAELVKSERTRMIDKLARHNWRSSNIWRHYYPNATGDWVDLRELRKLLDA